MKLNKAKKIMVYASKGGVGKTTVNLTVSREFAKKGYRICLIDMDPQSNISETVLGERDYDNYVSMSDLFSSVIDEDKVKSAIINVDKNIDIIGADINLIQSEMAVRSNPMCDQSRVLAKVLSYIENDYDIILMDFNTYPSLLTTNGFIASDMVIIPATCDVWDAKGIAITLSMISQINDGFGKNISYKVLLNKIGRNNDDKNFIYDIKEQLDENEIFKTQIHFQAKPFKDKTKTVIEYEKGNTTVGKEWKELLKEIEREVIG